MNNDTHEEVVFFDETGEERVIRRYCKRCRVLPRGSYVVSPSGTAHHGQDNGDTDCGLDATGANWWWPV